MEYQLLDRMSYQRLCGLANATNIPDRTTIWTFEKRIGEGGTKALFEGVTKQLLGQGYIAQGGQIIGATLVPAPKQHVTKDDKKQLTEGAMPADWKSAKRRQKDLDATWTKKHGKIHYGYKLSINVDKRYKIIHKIETDTASTHDSQHFEAVLNPANTNRNVFACKGYPCAEPEATLKATGYRNETQRKGNRNHPLPDSQERRNRRISQTRSSVEHAFTAITQVGGKLIRAIGQARAAFAMTMMAACYNLKRLTYLVGPAKHREVA